MKERIVDELTPTELKQLQDAITGYGKLKGAAKKAKCHFQTIKNIATIGRGEKNIIAKIRKHVIAA